MVTAGLAALAAVSAFCAVTAATATVYGPSTHHQRTPVTPVRPKRRPVEWGRYLPDAAAGLALALGFLTLGATPAGIVFALILPTTIRRALSTWSSFKTKSDQDSGANWLVSRLAVDFATAVPVERSITTAAAAAPESLKGSLDAAEEVIANRGSASAAFDRAANYAGSVRLRHLYIVLAGAHRPRADRPEHRDTITAAIVSVTEQKPAGAGNVAALAAFGVCTLLLCAVPGLVGLATQVVVVAAMLLTTNRAT